METKYLSKYHSPSAIYKHGFIKAKSYRIRQNALGLYQKCQSQRETGTFEEKELTSRSALNNEAPLRTSKRHIVLRLVDAAMWRAVCPFSWSMRSTTARGTEVKRKTN